MAACHTQTPGPDSNERIAETWVQKPFSFYSLRFLHIAVAQGDQPLTDFFIQRMKSRGIDIYNKLRQVSLS